MRTWGPVLATMFGLAALAPAAAAETFDELAAKAKPLSATDVKGMVWALTATCAEGDARVQSRCRQVRDRRAAELRAGTWLVDAEAGAFSIGAYDPDAKSVLVSLVGCIACKPVDGLYIVSNKAAPTFTGPGGNEDVATAVTVHQDEEPFPSQAAADRWRKRAGTVRAQFVFRIPEAAGGLFERDGHKGLAVAVLGYRMHQRCDGAIVAASPFAAPLAPEKIAACGAGDDTQVDTGPKVILPEVLTADDIKAVMRPVVTAAKECFDNYGVPGRAKLTYTITGPGAIAAYEQVGDFVDTPTGRCIDKAAKGVSFPATQKPTFTFTWPINVQ